MICLQDNDASSSYVERSYSAIWPSCSGEVVTQRCRFTCACAWGAAYAGNAGARVQRGSTLQAGGRQSARGRQEPACARWLPGCPPGVAAIPPAERTVLLAGWGCIFIGQARIMRSSEEGE
jgi:hypothetical protein